MNLYYFYNCEQNYKAVLNFTVCESKVLESCI